MQTGLKIQVENITKKFESGLTPLRDVSFTIEPGEFVSILGPSGCGKSTLLKMIAGLRESTSGTIQVGGLDCENRISYVFQEAHLLPWRRVLDNVLLPLQLLGVSKIEAELRARKALERVGLIDFESYYPANLSGGMKMRVSLARSLVVDPNLLLLDEPFAALDEVTRLRLDNDLRKLWMESKMTVLFVTHSISEAAFLSDRVLMLSKKTGTFQYNVKNPLSSNRDLDCRGKTEFAHLTHELFDKFQDLET